MVLLALAAGAWFGLVALMLIEMMRGVESVIHPWVARRPYWVAVGGGVFLAAMHSLTHGRYAQLGGPTMSAAMAGLSVPLFAWLLKSIATTVSLETGGSGGIVTPLFFIGATSGTAFAHIFHLPSGMFAAFGFVAVLAAAANTPIAACVMGLEILPAPLSVYAALCACTAYLLVGHRSVYASQKLGFVKSMALDVQLGGAIGDVTRRHLTVRPESQFAHLARRRRRFFTRKK